MGEVREEMGRLTDKFGVNVCGEGGEYETFTLDMPGVYFDTTKTLLFYQGLGPPGRP